MLITCPDRPGIMAAVSKYLFDHDANIVQSDQYTDPGTGMFFNRIEFDLEDLEQKLPELEAGFPKVSDYFKINWEIHRASRKKKLAIFVSREDHCLTELLWQWKRGDLYADISMVISNHEDLRTVANSFNIPYHFVPVHQDDKYLSEEEQMEIMGDDIDLVIFARYMQIVSDAFITRYSNRIINIHHSFLPAFAGGKPYSKAYKRGVKIIGATAHYVTAELDGGPIIEQDVERVTHRDSVDDLMRIGRHTEKMVLGKAVKLHLEDRILVDGNKTVIFR